jgi:hypothetical protein
MKRCLAAFAIAASLFAPAAHANDALEAKVRAYVPLYAILNACDIKINAAASDDNRAMLEAVKSDPDAKKLLARLHSETQAAWRKARDAGNRLGFCKDFIAANSQNAKARVTAEAEGYLSGVNAPVRSAIGHDVCKQGDAVKLSKGDRKGYETIQRKLQIQQKVAREFAQEQGWNVAEEVAAVTEQFCAAVNTR